MEHKFSSHAKIFGIVGFLLGIIALPISIITVFGFYAMTPAVIAIVFGLFSFFVKKQERKNIIFPIITTIIGIIAFGLSMYQYYQFQLLFDARSNLEGIVKDAVIDDVKEKAWKKITGDTTPSQPKDPLFTIKDTETNTPPQKDSVPLEEIFPIENLLFSTVDKLRIRSKPDLKSETLRHLNFGEVAIYLGEQSERKEQIQLGGALRNEYWKKIKYRSHNFEDYTVGWIYGGGVVAASEGYTRYTEDQYLKTVCYIPLKELSEVLGLQMREDYKSLGLISYQKSPDGTYFKQGRFYLKGKSKKGVTEIFELQPHATYEGNCQNGQPHGFIEKNTSFYETGGHYKVQFEHGNCVSYVIEYHSEGEVSIDRSDDPKDCPF